MQVAAQQANRAADHERELRQHQQARVGWLEANAHLGPAYRRVVWELAWQHRARGLAAEQEPPGWLRARAPRAEDTDWVRIASLYGDLVALTRSPIVELNRAVAVSMADGPAAGLAVTDRLLDVAALRTYHLLPSVRGDLLAKLGRSMEARAAFERAAELTSNQAERAHLLARASSS